MTMKTTALTIFAFLLLQEVCMNSASPASLPTNLKEIVQAPKNGIPDSVLNPSLQDVVPPLAPASSLQALKTPTEPHSAPSQSMFGDNVNLQWLPWNGSLPNGAVGIWNGYTSRADYVCKFNCEAGFYHPSKGPYCLYPYADKEYYTTTFDVLVNRDNFEFVEWLSGSYGSVPEMGVKTCGGAGIYVGKNKYGLGKVVPIHEAFFLPWEGKEYWYKSYQVLAINRESYSQHISHVEYGIDQIKLFHYPPETMRLSTVVNNECQTVKKTVHLEKKSEVETTWDIGRSTMRGVSSSISAKIPLIGTASVDFTKEKTFTFSRGTTQVESISHSVSIEVVAPPNHSCTVKMEGKKITADIPFTARLSRTYSNGETQWTTIVGKYDGVQIGELKAVVERCEPIADAKPCPSA
ncbi:natterin-3-like isoform X1 [Erpetoichthys calabaricus]|uniref:natterin-3-like isoform X1 n=2 Tax=Erpetoichthys calabaricus TaxID=27687 RepID=UPI002234178F|nr:natterin-3-like isoform X1 [Erpetoichthys calabaricus]